MKLTRLTFTFSAATLAALTALSLLGCGGGGGGSTSNPTPTPSPSPTPSSDDLVAGVSHNWKNGAQTTGDIGKSAIGFTFVAKTNITVTELGYYDDGGDGLGIDHPVTLFDATGTTRLAEATVRAGTVDTLRGKFRYRSITPVNLTAGTTYVLAGYHDSASTSDVFVYGTLLEGFITDSRITIASSSSRYLYYSGGTPLPFPTQSIGYIIYAGPSLFIP